MHIIQLIVVIYQTSYNKSECRYDIIQIKMSKKLVALLYAVLVLFAVSRIGGATYVAQAQMFFSSHIQPQYTNSQFNNNTLPPNNNGVSMNPICTPGMSSHIDNKADGTLGSGVPVPQYTNSQFNKSTLQPNNNGVSVNTICTPGMSSHIDNKANGTLGSGVASLSHIDNKTNGTLGSGANVSASLLRIEKMANSDARFFSNFCPILIESNFTLAHRPLIFPVPLAISNSTLIHPPTISIVPLAQTISFGNVIRATSLPPLTIFTTAPVQEICGNGHDDYILGSEGDDIIFGSPGNDVIMALGGNDLVFAGPGDDTVYGGDGNNQLFGGLGNDNLIGGIFDDLLVGGPGDDHLYGGDGDDILIGGPGADYFDCGDGIDSVVDYNPSEGDIVSSNCENVNQISP
jgi:hypothetical protein